LLENQKMQAITFKRAPYLLSCLSLFLVGCLFSLSACESISNNTKKPFVIAETAQPFTLAWLDQCHNAIGNANQLCSGFNANPKNQLNWLSMLWSAGKLKNNFRGMAYWEPAFVTQKEFSCDSQVNGGGSGWENMCLFDFNHHALPAAYFNWK
jgi:arabinogalactan endo-1,4-beta-galactosidase